MFLLTTMPAATDTITDFSTADGDKIDISRLLQGYSSGATATNYVHLTQQGSDMVLSVDADGALNGANFVNVALLHNTSGLDVTTLTANGNLVLGGQASSTNHPPVAVNDFFTGLQATQVHGNVLADNGSGPDSDPDGDALSVAAFSGTTQGGGSLVLNADGTFTYMPTASFAGTDHFSYVLLDGHGGSASATVSFQVSGLTGTSGNDVITAGSKDDLIHGLDGDDTILGGGGNDTIYGDAGNDTLSGNAGNDTLYAVSGNDILHGNDDNDVLYAGTGSDQLIGDNGNDILVAGSGSATLTGSGGNDIFRFSSVSGNVDTIADFHSSADKIDVSNIISFTPGDNILDYVHSTKSGTADTLLSVDADGAANGANFTPLALLVGAHFDVATMAASGVLIT